MKTIQDISVTELIENRLKHPKLYGELIDKFDEDGTLEKEKLAIIEKYVSPFYAVEILLLLKLPKEQIEEICKKNFKDKIKVADRDFLDELLVLTGYEKSSGSGLSEVKQFEAFDLWMVHVIANHYAEQERDRWLKSFLLIAKNNKTISTKEYDRLRKAYDDFRGSKVVKKNRKPYKEIVSICENHFIRKDIGAQWKNSVGIYSQKMKLTLNQKERLYKSFMKWKSGKTIEEMKSLLSEGGF